MISKTEDLIKKVMLKARQLTETSLEKNRKNIYRINMQHIKIISLFYAAIQSFFKIGQKVSFRGLYIREQKTET